MGRGSLLPWLSNLECEESYDECYDYENPLGLGLASCVIVHEAPDIKDCGSQVWNRYSCLVDPDDLTSRYSTVGLIPSVCDSIGVSLRPESVLVVDTSARLIDIDHSVYDQIVRCRRVGSEDDYCSVGNRRRVLATDHDESSNLQSAGIGVEGWVQPLAHATRGDYEDRILCAERQTNASPDSDGAKDYDPD